MVPTPRWGHVRPADSAKLATPGTGRCGTSTPGTSSKAKVIRLAKTKGPFTKSKEPRSPPPQGLLQTNTPILEDGHCQKKKLFPGSLKSSQPTTKKGDDKWEWTSALLSWTSWQKQEEFGKQTNQPHAVPAPAPHINRTQLIPTPHGQTKLVMPILLVSARSNVRHH